MWRDAEREQPRVVVARGRGEHERSEGPRQAPAEAGRGRAQHEPADTLRSAPRELLREGTAKRVAEHVDALEPQRVQQRADDIGKAAHPPRKAGPLRQPGDGHQRRDGDSDHDDGEATTTHRFPESGATAARHLPRAARTTIAAQACTAYRAR
jgi:hypothetical protein